MNLLYFVTIIIIVLFNHHIVHHEKEYIMCAPSLIKYGASPPHSPFMATSPLLIFSCFSQRPPLFSIPFYSLPEIIRVNCQAARLFSTLTFHDIGKVGGGGLLKLWISLLLEKRKKPITTFSESKENRQEMTTIRTIVYPLLFSQLRAKNSCYLVVISFRQFSFLSSRVQ